MQALSIKNPRPVWSAHLVPAGAMTLPRLRERGVGAGGLPSLRRVEDQRAQLDALARRASAGVVGSVNEVCGMKRAEMSVLVSAIFSSSASLRRISGT